MNRLTPRLTTLGLLALLLFQSIGWQAGWHVARQEVRSQMQVALRVEARRTVRMLLRQADFERARVEASEFFYQGKLYDIRSATSRGDSVEIVALHDSREQDLVETLHHLLFQDDSPGQHRLPVQTWWERWTNTVFLPPAEAPLAARPACSARSEKVFAYLAPVTNAVPQHVSPPPELQVG